MVARGRLAALIFLGVGLLGPTNALADVNYEPGRATWGKELLKVSTTGPDNLLPNFFFMAGGEEGGAYGTDGGYHGGTGEPSPFIPPDHCPAEVFEHTMKDERVPVMPYNEQDDWGCEQKPENLSVIVLENEYLRAAITPQWGGKIWSLYHKKLKRQLFFNNPTHQPNNIGYRKAWTSGGCEWNWAPGYIGHSVFTESPTWTARIPTEKGDIIRVWEYDRLNHTTWQVDIFMDKDVLWVHPKITNPRPIDLEGYWWTCVAMPVEENGLTRIVTPADLSITPCTAWPSGAYRMDNTTFRGANIDQCDAKDNCAWQQDMSFLGNIPSPHDFFMFRAGQESRYPHRADQPYIAHVLSDGLTTVHGHPLNGTKFFTWGEYEAGAFQQDFMSGSDYQNAECAKDQVARGEEPHYDPYCSHYVHKGKYTELQIGPGRSQMHTFPVPKSTEPGLGDAKGAYQWTEWFKAFTADPVKMKERDYAVPVEQVQLWLDGADGLSATAIDATDKWLKEMSSIMPKPEHMLYQGAPWGALYERITGKQLAPGLYFNVTNDVSGIRPWLELFETGGFSEESLNSVPTNFEVSDFWVQRLSRSIDAGNATWLHHLFLGSAMLERGDQAVSAEHFKRSLAFRPSVHAARALAVSAATVDEAASWFSEAWSIYVLSEKTAAMSHLGTNLAMEYSIWLTYQARWPELADLLGSDHMTKVMLKKDRVLHAQAALHLQQGDPAAAQAIIQSNCFPTYGSDRGRLIEIWETSHMIQEETTKGRPLTLYEQVLVRKRIGCLGDSSSGGGGSHCNRGPPNIGYRYG